MSISEFIIVATVLATLTYASILDLRKREVPEYVWIPGFIITITINILSNNYEPKHLALSLIAPALVFIMAFLGMIGGADALALLLIGLANSKFRLIPPSLIILIYSLIPPIVLMIYYALVNTIRYRDFTKHLKCINWNRGKYLIFLLGRVTSVKSYLRKKYVYPLSIPMGNGKYLCRTHFSLSDEEEESIRARIIDYVEKGIISRDEYIVITHGLPHILFFLIGYVVYLAIPETTLLALLRVILHK